MAPRRFSPLPLVALALALVGPATAIAQEADGDHDGVPDEFEEATARVVLIDVYEPSSEPGVVHIKSSSSGASPNDVFGFEYAAGRVNAEYHANASSETPSVAYRLRLRELVEVRGPIGGEIGGGDIVRSVALEDLLALGPIRVSNRTTTDGERETALDIGPANGSFRLGLHVVSRFSRIDGRTVTPMEIKVDFRIQNFTVAPGNVIAILVSMESGFDVRVEDTTYDESLGYAEGERAMNVSSAEAAAFFGWSTNATVDGQPRSVATTAPSGSAGRYETYLVYGGGASVAHDAKLGVVSQAFAAIAYRFGNPTVIPIPRGDPSVFIATVAALSGAVAAIAWWRRRRRA